MLEQHEPRDAEREVTDVADRHLFGEAPREPIEARRPRIRPTATRRATRRT